MDPIKLNKKHPVAKSAVVIHGDKKYPIQLNFKPERVIIIRNLKTNIRLVIKSKFRIAQLDRKWQPWCWSTSIWIKSLKKRNLTQHLRNLLEKTKRVLYEYDNINISQHHEKYYNRVNWSKIHRYIGPTPCRIRKRIFPTIIHTPRRLQFCNNHYVENLYAIQGISVKSSNF